MTDQVPEFIVQHLILMESVHFSNKEIYTLGHESAILSAIINTYIYGEQTESRFRSCSQDLEIFALD